MKTKTAIFVFLLVILSTATNSFLVLNSFAQWETDVRLTNAQGNSYTSYNNARCIAANGNVLHVVWQDYRDGNLEVYYKRSTDSGINWGVDTRLTNNTATSWSPSVAVSGLIVHVVWFDSRDVNNQIYYKRSTDGGINWGADTRLTNNTAGSQHPSISVSNSIVHVVWRDGRDGNSEIYYKRSTDGGINWGADTRLTNDTATSWSPSITVSGSIVHVVWEDERNNYPNIEIYYKRSTDGGINWGADTRLTNNTAFSQYPSIAVYDSLVNVVWFDYRDGNDEIYYKLSTDGGIIWGTDTRLTNNTADSEFPSIAVSGSIVHVVWHDGRNGYPNIEIYYKRSTDGGLTWGSDTRLTNNTAWSEYPSIAVISLFVHIVWTDLRDGNSEIYYKRNPTGNVGIKNISNKIPFAFLLEQNYPNPFNQSTKFNVNCSTAGMVKIFVFDISGKEVATLVNENLNPGIYEVRFETGKLPSGIYFYRLETPDFLDTKRMVLVK